MAAYFNEHTVLGRDGKLIKGAVSRMDIYSQSLHYGYSVFEGIRSYKTVAGDTRIFKAVEHFERLHHSASSLNIPLRYSTDELINATYAVLEANSLQDAYIRPIVYTPANMSFAVTEESFVAI